jgi:hypothetical protein
VLPESSGNAISIFETDLEVEFEEPRDYQEYLKKRQEAKEAEEAKQRRNISTSFSAPATSEVKKGYFESLGRGNSLIGTTNNDSQNIAEEKVSAESKEVDSSRNIVEDVGKWRFTYRLDSNGVKKLVKRVPLSRVSTTIQRTQR